MILVFLYQKIHRFQMWFVLGFLLLTLFDVSRFATKFESFSDPKYLFPKTKAINFLQEKSTNEVFRIATIDDRIVPANFSEEYKIQSVSGYDPLYLARYGEFVVNMESGQTNLPTQLPFNRIVNPKNYQSKLFDLLNVKYILSLEDIKSSKLLLVFQEGQTRVYENKSVLPRAFFVGKLYFAKSQEEAAKKIFAPNFAPATEAVVEGLDASVAVSSVGKANITSYRQNEVVIETENPRDGYLVLADSYYPGWMATIDGSRTKIFLTDFAFRGIFVPAGRRQVRFYLL